MLSFLEISDKFAEQIDTAGAVSEVVKDDRKFLLDCTGDCKRIAISLWSAGIIDRKEYDVLYDVIEYSFHKALDRYNR